MKRASGFALALFLVACGGNNGGDVDGSTSHPDAAHHDGSSSNPDANDTDGTAVDSHMTNPDSSTVDAAPGSYYTIPLTSPDGSLWGPQVTIGTQTFFMDLDTGSTTIGVAGSACTQCTSVTPKYAPGAGATDYNHTAQTEYADGSGWSGEIWTDTVSLAHGTMGIALKFVDISMQSDFFYQNEYQGIFGMGDTHNAEPNTDAYMNKEVAANGFTNSMAFELCGMNDGGGDGTMWLGGYDSSHASAAAVYTPLKSISNNQPFYAIDISGMSIGNTVVGTGAAAFEEPVVDTGTTYFYLPSSIFTATTNAIKGSTGYTALFGTAMLREDHCVTGTGVTAAMVDAMLPSMNISMPDMNGGTVTITALPMESYFYDGGNGMFCYALGNGGTQDATTMGDAIMRNFVTVIDIGNGQVGWAPDSGCGAPPVARSHFGKIARPMLPKRGNRAQ
ncbi:MAG TPA: pepsin-like aspartic protease [Kofleriaceae bacterium]|jgi:hypothetical protein